MMHIRHRFHRNCLVFLLPFLALPGCLTAEEEFVQDRLETLCDESYWICNTPSGCFLDDEHYVEGVFPGVRRVVVNTSENDMDVQVRIFLKNMRAPGTELLVQLYEADCTLDSTLGRGHMIDVDIFEEAGDDRILIFDLHVVQEGEHLLEIFSDMAGEYMLVVD